MAQWFSVCAFKLTSVHRFDYCTRRVDNSTEKERITSSTLNGVNKKWRSTHSNLHFHLGKLIPINFSRINFPKMLGSGEFEGEEKKTWQTYLWRKFSPFFFDDMKNLYFRNFFWDRIQNLTQIQFFNPISPSNSSWFTLFMRWRKYWKLRKLSKAFGISLLA